LLFFRVSIRKFRNINEAIRQIINEAISEGVIIRVPDSIMNAPMLSGMNKRNENFAAFSFGIFKKLAALIVIPDRDTPGNRART